MADVFISYAREDRLAAQKVADALKRHGWSVWWDLEIPPGKTWDELIERELASASCVVVLWSATSLAKTWVRTEAAEALARGVLVPALIEAVTPPLAFRQIQAAPLTDWRGDLDHAGFQQLLCTVCGLVGLPTRLEAKDKKALAGIARAKGAGGSARVQRGSGACAALPVLVADLAGAKLAEGPVPPPRREKLEMPPVARTGGIGRRFAGTAVIALVAALTGYGLRDSVDRFTTGPSQVPAGSNPLLESNAGPACAEGAAKPSDGTIAVSKGHEAVTRAELP